MQGLEENDMEARCFRREDCDELIQGSFPQYHGSTIRSVLDKRKFRVSNIIRTESMAVFTFEYVCSSLPLKLEKEDFIEKDEVRRDTVNEVFKREFVSFPTFDIPCQGSEWVRGSRDWYRGWER